MVFTVRVIDAVGDDMDCKRAHGLLEFDEL